MMGLLAIRPTPILMAPIPLPMTSPTATALPKRQRSLLLSIPIADAVDDSFATDEDVVLNADVSANDTHSATATYALNTGATNGTVIINNDGTFSYTPDPDFNGTDGFTYDVTDGNGNTETATVAITVNPIADAVDDSFATDEDVVLNADVSTNDTHSGVATYVLNTDATNGTVIIQNNGTFSYTPDPDFNGTDSFTYDVTDINGTTETATVNLTINPIADAVDDSFATDEDVVLNADVSTNDTHSATATYVTEYRCHQRNGNHPIITGPLAYTPDPDFNGTDAFTYDVTDSNGNTETATVAITVNPIADAVDDSFATDEDVVLNADVSTNDTHSTTATYALNTDATNGSVIIQ